MNPKPYRILFKHCEIDKSGNTGPDSILLSLIGAHPQPKSKALDEIFGEGQWQVGGCCEVHDRNDRLIGCEVVVRAKREPKRDHPSVLSIELIEIVDSPHDSTLPCMAAGRN
jgi:hypothetical protein